MAIGPIGKFWSCSQNNILLQDYAKEKLLKLANNYIVRIILSGTVSDDLIPTPGKEFTPETALSYLIPDSSSTLEEADHRIIIHIDWELKRTAQENNRCRDI